MIRAHRTAAGAYVARQWCTRLADWVTAYHVGAVAHGVAFPGAPVTGDTVDALNAALRRAGWRVTWA